MMVAQRFTNRHSIIVTSSKVVKDRWLHDVWVRWKNGKYTRFEIATAKHLGGTLYEINPTNPTHINCTKKVMQEIVQDQIWAICRVVAHNVGSKKEIIHKHAYAWMKENDEILNAVNGIPKTLEKIKSLLPNGSFPQECIPDGGPAMASWFVRKIGDTKLARELIEKACELHEVGR